MKQELLNRLRSAGKPVIISGAGVVGTTVLEICEQNDVRVAGFCDGSEKLAETDFHGFTVIPTSRLREYHGDALVLISVAAIKDVVELLRAQGFSDWIAAGLLLEDLDVGQSSADLDDRKFAIETCIVCHRGFLHPEQAFLRSVDLIITERCSLKCKDCANLMQYYARPQNVELGMLFRSFEALCSIVDEIMELRIIGGDAFMNKSWPRVVEKVVGETKIGRVVLYTNGTVVPKPEFVRLLTHPKVLTVVTDYGELSRNLAKLKVYMNEHRIAHRILQPDTWLDCASIAKHNRTPAENADIYRSCCAKNMLSLSDGKLFRCPFAANADRLAAVPEDRSDYVDVLAEVASPAGLANARRRIVEYSLRDKALSTCDYCAGRPLSGKEVAPALQTAEPLSYIRYSRSIE